MTTLDCQLNCNEASFLNKGGKVWKSVGRALRHGVSWLLKGIPGGGWIDEFGWLATFR